MEVPAALLAESLVCSGSPRLPTTNDTNRLEKIKNKVVQFFLRGAPNPAQALKFLDMG